MTGIEADSANHAPDLSTVRNLYGRALRTGDNPAERVGWESVAIQELRFEALLESLAASDQTDALSVLDVGCGLGDLYGYLHRTKRPLRYHGIDVLPEMVELARQRYPDGSFAVADLFELDPETTYDLVVSSGALSTRFGAAEQSIRFIKRMIDVADRAVAFNVQSSRELETAGLREIRTDFWYVDPYELVLQLRAEHHGLHFALREDTVPSDAVIYVYKRYSRTARSQALAMNALGQAEMHIQRDEYQDALDVLEGQSSLSSRARFLRGIAKAYLGDLGGALDDVEGAYAAAPADFDIARSLVALSIAGNDAERALRVAHALPAEDDEHGSRRDDVRLYAHEMAVAGHRPDEALTLERAMETRFARALATGRRAVLDSRWDDARRELAIAVETCAHDTRPRPLYAVALARGGDLEAGLAQVVLVLDVAAGHREARAIALDLMRKLARQGRSAPLEALRGHRALGLLAGRLLAGLSRGD